MIRCMSLLNELLNVSEYEQIAIFVFGLIPSWNAGNLRVASSLLPCCGGTNIIIFFISPRAN